MEPFQEGRKVLSLSEHLNKLHQIILKHEQRLNDISSALELIKSQLNNLDGRMILQEPREEVT
jgi:hypothetical protein